MTLQDNPKLRGFDNAPDSEGGDAVRVLIEIEDRRRFQVNLWETEGNLDIDSEPFSTLVGPLYRARLTSRQILELAEWDCVRSIELDRDMTTQSGEEGQA